MPAAMTWTNAAGNNDFYTAANWLKDGTLATREPVIGDDVTFDGTVSSANCTNLGLLRVVNDPGHGGGQSAAGAGSATIGLHSLRLISGYSGTVTIIAPLQTGTFVLSAAPTGSIAQQPTGSISSDLTVTDTFTWTSGTLNSSANDATVNINGGGSIAPTNAGTVTLGSTLIFTGTQPAPKETTIDPGTIAAVRGGIVVGAFATVTARTYTSGDIVGWT